MNGPIDSCIDEKLCQPWFVFAIGILFQLAIAVHTLMNLPDYYSSYDEIDIEDSMYRYGSKKQGCMAVAIVRCRIWFRWLLWIYQLLSLVSIFILDVCHLLNVEALRYNCFSYTLIASTNMKNISVNLLVCGINYLLWMTSEDGFRMPATRKLRAVVISILSALLFLLYLPTVITHVIPGLFIYGFITFGLALGLVIFCLIFYPIRESNSSEFVCIGTCLGTLVVWSIFCGIVMVHFYAGDNYFNALTLVFNERNLKDWVTMDLVAKWRLFTMFL